VVAVATVIAAVDNSDVVARWLTFNAVVVALHCLAIDIAVGGVVVVAGDLRRLWLRCWGRIASSNS